MVTKEPDVDPVTEIDPRFKKLSPGEKMPRGHFTGWCNSCGADCFNFVRHQCPPKLEPRVSDYLRAVSLYVRARRILRASTIDTHAHALATKAEREAFDYLSSIYDQFNANTSNGTEG